MKQNWKKLRDGQIQFESFLMREKVIDAIRAFFKKQDFHEVETPLMVKSPGMEPYLEVFETGLLDAGNSHYRAFLTTSPEYAMKKLLVAGIPKIFQICKSFRNGEDLRSSTHNPEFTIMEWYRINADYTTIMSDCEVMTEWIYDAVIGKSEKGGRILKYQGQEIDVSAPWERISVSEAFEKYAGVVETDLQDDIAMRNWGKKKGYAVSNSTTWEQMFNQIFLNDIEPHLGFNKPTILYDYPASMAALSRKKPDNPLYAERFEYYILGKELGNAFSELNDAQEQEDRLRAERVERESLGKNMYDVDEDFIDALKVGMPDAAGIAVGIDRMVMLFADVPTIQETIWFPANEMFDEK
ncbi:MAG: EF-P lysine aminoacylase EpmA [bacterium]|nr:EF-P lysine aminoacylase EpmA [bacterium]